MRLALTIIGGILAVLALGFVLNVAGMWNYSFFGKWQEEIRHDIQMESTAFRQGNQNNLQQMLNDYNTADAAGKQAILSGVRAQYSGLSAKHLEEMPGHLRDFLRTSGMY